MKQTSLGHYTATSEGIRALKWVYYVGEDEIDPELPGQESWNRDQRLVIECNVDIDLDLVRRQTYTDDRTSLAWIIIARSDAPKVLASKPVRAKPGQQRIMLAAPGGDIAGRVKTELTLGVVGEVTAPLDRFAPHLPGHRVFTTYDGLRLEGNGAQLPLLPVSFKEHGVMPGGHGLWWLRVNHLELEAPASSALWLWLNSDNPDIAALLDNSNEPQHRMLANFMAIDFSRQLLSLALTVEDLDLEADYPEHSLGVTLAGVVRLVGETLPQVRLAYQTDPGSVEAKLQALVAAAAESS